MTLTYGEGASREGIQNLCLQSTEAELCSSHVAGVDQLDVAMTGSQWPKACALHRSYQVGLGKC